MTSGRLAVYDKPKAPFELKSSGPAICKARGARLVIGVDPMPAQRVASDRRRRAELAKVRRTLASLKEKK